MKTRFAKILSIALVLIMALSVLPHAALARVTDGNGTTVLSGWFDRWWDRFFPRPDPTPSYPAQTMSYDAAGGVSVYVDAPAGALPANTSLDVAQISNLTDVQAAFDHASDERGTVRSALDISFLNRNKDEVEPKANVTVIITDDVIASLDSFTLVHFKGSAEDIANGFVEMEVVEDCFVSGNTVTFEASDFSVYAVVDDEVVADESRLAVRFFGEDTVNPLYTVYIKQSENTDEMLEKLLDFEPEVVTNSLTVNDLVFCGWIPYRRNYTVSDFIDGDHDIDQVRAAVKRRLQREVAEGDVMNVYAMLFYEYSVKYVGEEKDGKNPVLEAVTLYSKDGSPVDYQIDLSYTPNNLSTSKFNGWLIEGDSSNTKYQYGDTLTVAGDTVLMTDVSNGHWIAFNEKPTDEYKGAKYVAPKFFETNETMDGYTPADSSLAGYHFDGWYTDTTYTTRFNFTGKLTENKTLYAKWTMNSTADYTVIVWQQDVNDSADQSLEISEKQYNYVCSVTVNNASTSSTINSTLISAYTNYGGNASATIGKDTYNFTGFHYEGFTFANDNNGKVHPAGTTVVNVYYDRNYHTFTFQDVTGYSAVSGTPSYTNLQSGDYYVNLVGSSYFQVLDANSSSGYVYAGVPWSLVEDNTDVTFYIVYSGSYYAMNYSSSRGYWYVTISSQTYEITEEDGLQIYYRFSRSSQTYYTANYTTIHTASALYGQDISNIWSFTGSNGKTYPQTNPVTSWQPVGNSTYTARITKQIVMPDTDITYRHRTTANTTRYFYYYVEALEGASNTVTYNGTQYVRKDYLPNDFNIVFYEDDFWNLSGFTRQTITDSNNTGVTISTSGSSWEESSTYSQISLSSGATANTLYFWYTRNQYNIHYMWGSFYDGNNNKLTPEKVGEIKSVDGIYYETDIDSYKVGGGNYFDPTRTLGNPGYVFEGWYIDPDCTVPYDFTGKTMPANDIAVFAKFRTVQYRVFLRNCGESGTESYEVEFNDENQAQNFRINYGEYISGGSPIEATRSDGMILAGWYLDAALTEPFDFEQEITNANTVDYDKEDPFNYTDPASGTTPPWTINKDVSRTWITRKLDLYAKWVSPLANVDGINVVYDANDSGTVTGTRQKDGTHTGSRYYTDPALYSDGVAAFVRTASTPDDSAYTFDYWELLDKNGNVIGTYKPGEKFVIDAATMARLENPAAGSKGAGSEAQRDGGKRSGSPIVVPTATSDRYQLVSSLESGGKYLITYTSGSTTYVVTYNEYSSTYGIVKSVAATPTTSGDYTTFSTDLSSYQYTASGSASNGWSFYSPTKDAYFGTYYYSSNSAVYAAMMTGAQSWTYDGSKLYMVRSGYTNGSNGTYYLMNYSSSSTYGNSVDVTSKVANAGTFRFYKLVEPSLNEALNVSGGELEFTNDATYPWTVVTDTANNRIYAQSGNAGVGGSSSDVKLTLTMAAGDTLSFDYYVSSESGYDYFRFLVNGTPETSASGTSNTSWRTYTFTADAAGTYTFTWRYIKDSSTNSGNDCARVDNVSYTATAPAATYQVSFLDKDGNVISGSTQTVTEGDKPTAPADPAAPEGKRFDGWTIQGGGNTVYSSNDLPEITEDTVFVAHFSDLPLYGWYFETSPSADGWTFVDSDGDSYNWVWQENYTGTHCTAYEGEGLIYSESFSNAASTALNPDNWAITPAVTLPTGSASVTLFAKGQSADYAAEHFAIYVGTSANPSEMTKVSDEFVATGEYKQYEVDLSDYVGQTVYVAIRHYNVSDMFILDIDQVEIWGENAIDVPQGPYTVIFWDGYADEQIGAAQTVNHGEAATAPEPPVHEGYTFIGWSTTFSSVTHDMTVVANYRSNSANVDLNTMTVLMRAHYSTKQYTFITWHANNGSGEVKDSEQVLINENIPIEFPDGTNTDTETGASGGAKDGEAVVAWPVGGELTWEDHIFLGWARVEVGDKEHGVGAEYDPESAQYVKERSYSEDDLFLKYYYPAAGEEKGHFEAMIKGAWTTVEYVAADELDPYHGMYAVWADVFYVYHSGTNTVEKIVRTTKSGTYDLTQNINTDNYLYGGYYTEYNGVSTGYESNKLAWTANKAVWNTDGSLNLDAMCEDLTDSAAGAKAYNGSNVKWDVTKAYTAENALAITPVAGATYYIKEVPAAKYLRPYLHYTYYTDPANHNPIGTAWLISDVDDLNYQQSGFVIVSGNNQATIVKSITVSTTTDPENVEILTSAKLFGARGYLSYLTVINDGRNGEAVVNLLADNQSVAQYWVTPDGLIVTGTVSRVYTGLANKDNIACTPTTSASTISLFVAPTPAG